MIRQPVQQRTAASSQADSYRGHALFGVFATGMLAALLLATLLLWPVPHLQYSADLPTGTILSVELGGPADRAGLRPGDVILRRYDYAWADLDKQLTIYPLAWGRVVDIPFLVKRNGLATSIIVPAEAPALAFQLEKATNLLLSLACWATGYILGTVRRHDVLGTPLLGWFWVSLGGALGIFLFAYYSSFLLAAAITWLMISVLAPLAVYVHLWYPARKRARIAPIEARRWLLAVILAFQICLVIAYSIGQPSIIALRDVLGDLLAAAYAVAFIVVGAIIARDYPRTQAAHVRRQMRLLTMANSLVAVVWLLFRVLPDLLLFEQPVDSHWLDLVSIVIPIGYLVGGVVPDLYRVDRVAQRVAFHAGVIALLSALILVTLSLLDVDGPLSIAWAVASLVALYRPSSDLLVRLTPRGTLMSADYSHLHAAARQLATTLKSAELVQIVCSGVREAFGRPPIGFYVAKDEENDALVLVHHERLVLPDRIDDARLMSVLGGHGPILESRALFELTSSDIADELVNIPGVVLWCPVKHTRGHLLGLLLVGMRGDLDPYREEDLRELQRLLGSGTLAFTNSAIYEEQSQAEQMIRQLYQRLQQAQDATARAIAQELHDEALNINVRLNIETLQRIIPRLEVAELRVELERVLEGERTLGQMLRLMCENLYPTGIDDPLGLPAVLRQQIERIQASWGGLCRLVIEHTPCPIAPTMQHEVLRVTREAVMNAVKHAGATEITVRLAYPAQAGAPVTLSIADNGRGGVVTARPGHWGVRNMRESARAVGGTLVFSQQPGQGIEVVLQIPAPREQR